MMKNSWGLRIVKGKKVFLTFCLLLTIFPLSGLAQQIIPFPAQYKEKSGELTIPHKLTISSADIKFAALIPGVTKTAERFFDLKLRENKRRGFIELRRNRNLENREEYRVEIGPKKIVIEAGFSEGGFYGLQSVLQLLANASGNLKMAVIKDKPRYEWRGLLLDEARHFYGKEQVKSILDFMALHKLNRFHWHLTDDAGWRVEIKKYPRLTTVGAIGNVTDSTAQPQFYTQAEIREIVNYARERFIEIIPEIDMPGHASAAVRAYPKFSGGGSPENPDFTFNPGKEGTYVFLTDILIEIKELFPSSYVHIGGDEVHFGNRQWDSLPEVQKLMEAHHLADVVEVEHYFLRRMARVLEDIGKTVVVWDEAVPAGLPNKNTLIMWWRHHRSHVLQEGLDAGYRVVLCPRIPMYFDFVQDETHTHGRKWDEDYAPLQDVYRFPDPEFTNGIPIDNPLIKGVQANLWTPTMHTPERLQFMLFPRISALAEAGWTTEDVKDWSHFKERLKPMFKIFQREGINYYDYTSDDEELPGPEK